MRLTRPTRYLIAGVATAGAVALSAGVAWSFWATSATGSAAAASAAALPLQLTPGVVAGNLLSPTTSGDVVLVVSNPNPYAVSLDALTLPTTGAVGYTTSDLSTPRTGCTAATSGVTWGYTTKALTGVVVARRTGATNGTLTLTLTNGASMSAASDNTCQSTFFKLPDVTSATGSSTSATPVSTITR